jgi:hypothetical protein
MQRERIEVGTTVRVENGPTRKTTIATEEVLDDKVTAVHYKVGQGDAMGKPIVLGEEMTYLDYRGQWVWYIYQLGEVGIDKDGVVILPGDKSGRKAIRTEERWIPAGVEESKAAALAVANGLAGEGE